MCRWLARVSAVAAVLLASLTITVPAQADASGTWTNTGPLNVADCATTWTGQTSYSLPETSIIKITLAAGGLASCSVTIKSADLSTWQVSLDSGTSWTTLSGTFYGIPANGGPQQIWFRVGRTSATIGSGNYSDSFGANFQNPVISITPIVVKGSAEFTFWLPDGRECTNISPVSVPIDSVYVLPQAGADCKTSDGSIVVGWKVGWDDLVHPPGHPVLVVDSQQFTAVIQEEILTVDYDANVGALDQCLIGKTNTPAASRTISQEVVRANLRNYRIMVDPICIPPAHYFAGWSTQPAGEPLPIGSPAPANWLTTAANSVTLFAQWEPIPPLVIDVMAFPPAVQELTPVQVMVGSVTPAPSVDANELILTSAPAPSSVLASASPAMSQAIDDFFTNGGQSLTIIPSGGSDAASLTAAINRINVANALDLAVPELRGLTAQEWVGPASALVTKASEIEAMAWLDPPAQTVAVPATEQEQAIDGVIALAERLRVEVGTMENAGTLLSTGVVDSSGAARAASPATLGVRVTTDSNVGVWNHMGAFDGLAGVTSETNPTPQQRGDLMSNGVSAVIDFASGQTIVAPNVTLNWTVRTTQQRFDDWLLQSLNAGLAGFEKFPNGHQTWTAMTEDIASFFYTLYQEGALSGNTLEQAYQIDCSATQQAIKDGYVTCDLTLELLMPPPRVFTLQVPVQPGLPTRSDPDPPTPVQVFPTPNNTQQVPSIVP